MNSFGCETPLTATTAIGQRTSEYKVTFNEVGLLPWSATLAPISLYILSVFMSRAHNFNFISGNFVLSNETQFNKTVFLKQCTKTHLLQFRNRNYFMGVALVISEYDRRMGKWKDEGASGGRGKEWLHDGGGFATQTAQTAPDLDRPSGGIFCVFILLLNSSEKTLTSPKVEQKLIILKLKSERHRCHQSPLAYGWRRQYDRWQAVPELWPRDRKRNQSINQSTDECSKTIKEWREVPPSTMPINKWWDRNYLDS